MGVLEYVVCPPIFKSKDKSHGLDWQLWYQLRPSYNEPAEKQAE